MSGVLLRPWRSRRINSGRAASCKKSRALFHYSYRKIFNLDSETNTFNRINVFFFNFHTYLCVLHARVHQSNNIFPNNFLQCLHPQTASPVTTATGSLVEQAACCHRDTPAFPWRWGTGRLCVHVCVCKRERRERGRETE